jgi:hypothetical protein
MSTRAGVNQEHIPYEGHLNLAIQRQRLQAQQARRLAPRGSLGLAAFEVRPL